jgi:hypothetical protein
LQEASSVDSTFIINRLGPNQSVLKENLDSERNSSATFEIKINDPVKP